MFSSAFRLTLSWIFGKQYKSRDAIKKEWKLKAECCECLYPQLLLRVEAWLLLIWTFVHLFFFFSFSLTRGSRCGHGHVILLTCRTLTYPFFTSLDKPSGPSGSLVILFLFARIGLMLVPAFLCACVFVCIIGITMPLAEGNTNNNNDNRAAMKVIYYFFLTWFFCSVGQFLSFTSPNRNKSILNHVIIKWL